MTEPERTAVLEPYVPRLLVSWLRETPDATWREVEGSLAFVDISGFTALTERLARKGKVGAEEMSDILNGMFADLLQVAYADGAGLVKWGGDAVLLLFEGERHAERAARAAYRMRARLARIGRYGTGSGRVVLRMSVGIHSGAFHFFLVGDPTVHRELIISGPAASRCAEVEGIATADEIGLSEETAALLPPVLVGEHRDGIVLLAGEPRLADLERIPRPPADGLDLPALIPPPIREHLLSAAGEPEHRQIAVGFVQFSGTDGLLEREGPGALAEALDAVVRNVQDATTHNGVTFFESDINRDGGKIMLTAGAPSSADHSEERMLRATRTVVERIGRLPLRVGVNCGPVFAGDFGPPFRRTFSVKGDAINLAARVMGKAEPGQLLATLAVLTRSRSRFDVEPLPPFTVKGKAQPVEAASVGRLLAERDAGEHDATLVGREAELAALREALGQARSGAGRMVDLVGEPGIGKSRLVLEFVRAAEVPAFRTRCDEYETATAYWPFRSLIRQVVGVALDASDDDVVNALLHAAQRRDRALVPWLPLIGAVLDVPMPATPEVDALADEYRAQRTVEVTARFLRRLRPAPTLWVVEDAHLMDAASVSLLTEVVAGLEKRPWLVLVARRDTGTGFEPPDRPEVQQLRPQPLAQAAARAMARELLQDKVINPADVDALVARADGNPLFLRGLMLAVANGSTVDSLPDTVEALVTSQIDRLPPDERAVLRYASVLGVAFHEAELRALLQDQPLPTGRSALRRLSYFVRQEGHGRYRFEHQLIRDTAYEGLPYRRRRLLHGRAGEFLESQYANPDEVAELLSLHYFHAGMPERTWRFALVAGERARTKGAYAQADQLLTRAASVMRGVPGLVPPQRADLHVALGEARFRSGRSAAALEAYRAARRDLSAEPVRSARILRDEAEAQLRLGRLPMALRTTTRGLRLVDGHHEAPALAVRSRLEAFYAVARQRQGKYRQALQWARSAEEHAEVAGDPVAQAEAYLALFDQLMNVGALMERPYGDLALAAYERLGDKVGQFRALNNSGMYAWMQGRGVDALALFQAAEALATESGYAYGAANARYNVADVLVRMGRPAEAAALFTDLLPVLHGLGMPDFEAIARRGLGVSQVLLGAADDGRTLLDEARAALVELDEVPEVVETDAAIALALLLAGRAQDAEVLAADGAARAEELGAGYLIPWLERLQGAALGDLGRNEEARRVLTRALASADLHSKVEVGFVLAELSRLADRAGDVEGARRLSEQATEAFDLLGFAGGPRYPRD